VRSPQLTLRAVVSSPDGVVVALTRESGKNEKLQAGVLGRHPSLNPVELPCIAHADGPDYKDLKATLQDNDWDYVAITSPEAARVLVSAWNDCTFPNNQPPAVTAVGKATEEALKQAGISVAFCPSKATAATLVKELPMPEKGSSSSPSPRVLYPASARAQKTLENGLTERGFEVVRLNTYDTVTAVWTDEEREFAGQVKIACFASPSAVKGWLINSDGDNSVLAACIGETSAKACREQGWSEESIFYPDKPGMEGWVQAVADASTTLRCGYQTT
jgi:uroporphyrinogen-III synthase